MSPLAERYTEALIAVIDRHRDHVGITERDMRTPRKMRGYSVKRLHRIAGRLCTTTSALLREAEAELNWEDTLTAPEGARDGQGGNANGTSLPVRT